MKKLIALILAMSLVLALFAGCAGDKPEETTEPTDVTGESTEDTTEDTTAESTDESIDETPGDVYVGVNATLEEIINAIYVANPVEFMAMSMPIDVADKTEDGILNLQAYTGLENGDLLAEAMVSEAAIGVFPFSLVLVRVNDPADAQSVADAMCNGINQRKWVCVEADDLQVITRGDLVMLVMINTENGAAADFVKAFASVVGEPEYAVSK